MPLNAWIFIGYLCIWIYSLVVGVISQDSVRAVCPADPVCWPEGLRDCCIVDRESYRRSLSGSIAGVSFGSRSIVIHVAYRLEEIHRRDPRRLPSSRSVSGLTDDIVWNHRSWGLYEWYESVWKSGGNYVLLNIVNIIIWFIKYMYLNVVCFTDYKAI